MACCLPEQRDVGVGAEPFAAAAVAGCILTVDHGKQKQTKQNKQTKNLPQTGKS